jgi:hypothetical protein
MSPRLKLFRQRKSSPSQEAPYFLVDGFPFAFVAATFTLLAAETVFFVVFFAATFFTTADFFETAAFFGAVGVAVFFGRIVIRDALTSAWRSATLIVVADFRRRSNP